MGLKHLEGSDRRGGVGGGDLKLMVRRAMREGVQHCLGIVGAQGNRRVCGCGTVSCYG